MIETLIFIFLLVILLILLQQKSELNRKIDLLEHKMDELQFMFRKSPETVQQKPKETVKPAVEQPKPVEQVPAKPVISEPKETMTSQPKEEHITQHENVIRPFAAEPTSKKIEEKPADQPQKAVKKTFTERHPDLEKYIGENLFNKIGIAILVLGMGFFLKYAIDKNWINEIGRTLIGILTGGLLVGIAHKMRKTFAAFSSVLVGGGIAILYFTITIAFQQYHLINQTLAFMIMILITGFTVLLSVSYDRKELAILAILGGFTSPFLVSSGEGNYIVLFSYLLLLNIGMLVLAYFKKWNILNIICYVFTLAMFGTWLAKDVVKVLDPEPDAPYKGALVFATLFYFTFFLMNVINNIKERSEFKALEISILLSNTFFYFTVGMLVLHAMKATAFQGLFTALLGIFNMIFAYALYKNEKVDKNLIYLLIGLVLTFCSLVAPIQLEGNHITLFWSAEAVLLLWLSQKSGIIVIRKASVIVLILMIISLAMDWMKIYVDYYDLLQLRPFSNKGFITGVIAILAIVLLKKLVNKETKEDDYLFHFNTHHFQKVLEALLIAVSYFVFRLEINHQAAYYFNEELYIIVGCYNYLFIIILMYLAIKAERTLPVKAFLIGLGIINVMAYPVFYNKELILIRTQNLLNGNSALAILLHLSLTILFFVTLYQLYKAVKSLPYQNYFKVFQWFAAVISLFVFSAELDHFIVSVYGNSDTYFEILSTITHKAGYAILWGLFGFVLIYLGMRWKSRNVRIISLSVFAVTLLKLFLFDLKGISEGGKIAAFLSLGVLLLVISFMYQRLKRLLLADDKSETVTTDNTN